MANEFPAAASGAGTQPAGSAALEPRAVGIGRGTSWWGEGWRLFTPSVGVWILVVLILAVLNVVLNLIPVVGPLASQILFPVFTGGLMLGCRALDRGNPLTVGHMFGGFSQRTGPLLLVGVIYTVLVIAVVVIVAAVLFVSFGAAVIAALASMGDTSQAGLGLGSMLLAVAVGCLLFLALWLPVVMAVWFAPTLVMLGGEEPWAAMKLSFRGCLKNFVTFLLYGLIGIVLAIVASIPFGLGWLVLAPVTIATIYASYCDIFEDKDTV